MTLLRFLAAVFVDTFGITHPSLNMRDRTAWYIALLMLLLLLILGGFVALGIHTLRR